MSCGSVPDISPLIVELFDDPLAPHLQPATGAVDQRQDMHDGACRTKNITASGQHDPSARKPFIVVVVAVWERHAVAIVIIDGDQTTLYISFHFVFIWRDAKKYSGMLKKKLLCCVTGHRVFARSKKW